MRVSFFGGGTDYPEYFNHSPGAVLGMAIDKYVYVSVIKPFHPGIYLKYSEIEHVDDVEQSRERSIGRAF